MKLKLPKTLFHVRLQVAVKVQHLKVKQHSFIDIYTMEFLAKTVKFFFPAFEFMWLVEETKRNLPLELDFSHEGRNNEMVGKFLDHHSWLKVSTFLDTYRVTHQVVSNLLLTTKLKLRFSKCSFY